MALCMCSCCCCSSWPAVLVWLRRKLGSTTRIFSRRPRAINYGATVVNFTARWPSWRTSFSHTSADPRSRIRVREHHIRLRVLAVMSPWWSLAVVARLSSRLLTCDRARRTGSKHVFSLAVPAITYVRDRHILMTFYLYIGIVTKNNNYAF